MRVRSGKALLHQRPDLPLPRNEKRNDEKSEVENLANFVFLRELFFARREREFF